MRINEPVTQKEREYPAHCHLITTTDLRGKITAANEEFAEIAGYSIEELVGQHPQPAGRHSGYYPCV